MARSRYYRYTYTYLSTSTNFSLHSPCKLDAPSVPFHESIQGPARRHLVDSFSITKVGCAEFCAALTC